MSGRKKEVQQGETGPSGEHRTANSDRVNWPEKFDFFAMAYMAGKMQAPFQSRRPASLESDYGWDRWRAYDLLTHVARISVGYYALGTVAVKVAKEFIGAPRAPDAGAAAR